MTSPRAPSSSEPLEPHVPTVRSDLPEDQGRLGGSVVDWWGLGDLLEVRVPSDGLWVGEVEVEEQFDPPVRREPFPNPEAALWRPKAW